MKTLNISDETEDYPVTSPNPKLPRCPSCFEPLHTAQDGTVYGHTEECEKNLPHCSGCTDKDPLGGTHAGHTIEHGHIGCEHQTLLEDPRADILAKLKEKK